MIAALLFMLAAVSHVDLIDESFEIPAHDWRYVPRPIAQQPEMVDCQFQANQPGAQIRLVLLSQADVNAWRLGREHQEIAATPAGPAGTLRMPVHDLDTYIVVENRGPKRAGVRLRIFLDEPQVRYLSRDRRLAVTLISFGVFVAVVTLSARKLLKIRHR